MLRSEPTGGWSRFSLIAAAAAVIVGVFGSASPASATHGGEHWARDGLTNSQVYFVDHTGASWPVTTATANWDQARSKKGARLNLYRVSSCPNTSVHCVHVREYTNSTAPYSGCKSTATYNVYGCTIVNVYTSTSHLASAAVYLNSSHLRTAEHRKMNTCHELGHALRLKHRATNTSCMTSGTSPPVSQYPDDHDYSTLAGMYNGHAN